MLTVNATEMKQRMGQYIEKALVEPVVIQKSDRPIVVMISMSEFQRFQDMEDRIWSERAVTALRSGLVGSDKAEHLLLGKLDEAGHDE